MALLEIGPDCGAGEALRWTTELVPRFLSMRPLADQLFAHLPERLAAPEAPGLLQRLVRSGRAAARGIPARFATALRRPLRRIP